MLSLSMKGKLSIVATPIGNLRDLSERARQTLVDCALIVCEDTRVTSKLLHAYGISRPLRSLHERSSDAGLKACIRELEQGKHLAYVSDAGTPGVNDPGGKLVAAAFEHGYRVEPIPGPSALVAAISVCGFPMDDFRYRGFVPHKKGRQTFFHDITEEEGATLFFESPHRILKTLDALESELAPERLVFVGRELTKLHESLYRGTAAEVKRQLYATSLKGEFVLIVAPNGFR